MNTNVDYQKYLESSLFGRYINNDHIKALLDRHSKYFEIKTIGKSVLNEDISLVKIGVGIKKILIWSQMHGNESTTTKAVFDLLNVFADTENPIAQQILQKSTIAIIPILSPDGARAYTRVNANNVDLNRDAQNLSQPESRVLRACFESFKPDYCFNLHGQRTIFGAGTANKSAIVSFLSPAEDENRTVTATRKKAMDVIVKMDQYLQQVIPGHVGTYDDAFNINCVGDTFQSLGTPTILFEAGHYPEDYNREQTRKFIWQSLCIGVYEIALQEIDGSRANAYFKIPPNKKSFYDIIIRNAKLKFDLGYYTNDIAIQYHETLDQDHIVFIPQIEKISDLKNFFGHKEIDAEGVLVSSEGDEMLKEGFEIDFVLINETKHLLNV